MAGVNTDNSDRIKESLNACLTTCLKLPEQAQGEVIRELSYISKITISKEKCLTTTDKVSHNMRCANVHAYNTPTTPKHARVQRCTL